jgi:hypothetical protein
MKKLFMGTFLLILTAVASLAFAEAGNVDPSMKNFTAVYLDSDQFPDHRLQIVNDNTGQLLIDVAPLTATKPAKFPYTLRALTTYSIYLKPSTTEERVLIAKAAYFAYRDYNFTIDNVAISDYKVEAITKTDPASGAPVANGICVFYKDYFNADCKSYVH